MFTVTIGRYTNNFIRIGCVLVEDFVFFYFTILYTPAAMTDILWPGYTPGGSTQRWDSRWYFYAATIHFLYYNIGHSRQHVMKPNL